MTLQTIKPAKPQKLMTVINLYARHTGRLKESLEELEEMYEKLDTLLLDPTKTKDLVFIAVNLNAKVGKLENTTCLGRYSRGKTNNSGMILIEFCEAHSLFVSNTAFRNSARHINLGINWNSGRKNYKGL